MMRNKAALGGLVATVAMVIAGACTNDFDYYTFNGMPGGGGSGASTTTTGGGGTAGGPSCDPATCPGSDTDCAKRACDNANNCIVSNEASGTACTDTGDPDAKVCDGQGVCVECNDAGDCTGTDICDQNQCVPITCTDNTQNGGETDVDCGGPDCAPCANGLTCIEAGDCASGFCEGAGGGGGGGGAGGAGGGSTTGTCAPCVTESDCQSQQWCNGGVCEPQGDPGDNCGDNIECKSGNCPADDLVCCDTACGALCEACQASKTGGTDGTCAPVTAGTDPDTECTASDAQCNTGQCSGTAGQCEAAASNVVCRAQSGGCDIEETCNGTSTGCPGDAMQNNGFVCRAQNGGCDIEEICNGSSKDCPVDDVQNNGYVCRAKNGVCDVAESCDGVSKACPGDDVVPANSMICRPVALPDYCDVPEMCDGSNKACPPDGFKADGQPSTGGGCNPYLCDGNQAGCPSSCQQPGDCTPVPPYTCSPNNICCMTDGSTGCSGNTDCCSGNCLGGTCTP